MKRDIRGCYICECYEEQDACRNNDCAFFQRCMPDRRLSQACGTAGDPGCRRYRCEDDYSPPLPPDVCRVSPTSFTPCLSLSDHDFANGQDIVEIPDFTEFFFANSVHICKIGPCTNVLLPLYYSTRVVRVAFMIFPWVDQSTELFYRITVALQMKTAYLTTSVLREHLTVEFTTASPNLPHQVSNCKFDVLGLVLQVGNG